MTQYNTLNVKLSNLQVNKLKSQIKNGTEVTLKLSSNVAGDSNDENNFPHKLLLTLIISNYYYILIATLLENLFAGKGTIRVGEDTIRAGEGTIIAGQDF